MTHPAEANANPPKVIVSAEGVEVIDEDGKRYVDALAGGLWNVNLGFSCEPVKKAMADQLQQLPYYSSFRGTTTEPTLQLAHEVLEWTKPEGMARAFFTSGGSDSVETALRLSRQFHKLRGHAGRTKFISLRGSYHGTHFGGASLTGNAMFRNAYEPLLPGCFQVAGIDTYRNEFDESDPERLATLVARMLEAEIVAQGPDTVAAFIMEPIQGSGGVYVPHPSFMPAVREICTRHGVLLIADEVITGFGRAGSWFGSRLWGVKPDMMCVAKAITTGYFPLGACLVNAEIAETFETAPLGPKGAVMHGYTYSGHPVGAAAALAALAETKRLNVTDSALARGSQLLAGCQDLQERYDVVGDVRGGHGLAVALELVSDRATKAPLDPVTVGRIHQAIYDAGAVVRVAGHKIILSPALVLEPDHVSRIVDAIAAGFDAA